MLKIDRHTKWIDFAAMEHCISAEDTQRIMEKAVTAKYGENGFYMLTIKELLDGMHGEFAELYEDEGKTVFDIYRVRAFSAWLRDFVALVDSFSLKPTAKQIRYANGCVEMSFDESVYVFLREYFNLPCFDDVLGLTVGDYLLAKKDNFNRMTIERNQLQALK